MDEGNPLDRRSHRRSGRSRSRTRRDLVERSRRDRRRSRHDDEMASTESDIKSSTRRSSRQGRRLSHDRESLRESRSNAEGYEEVRPSASRERYIRNLSDTADNAQTREERSFITMRRDRKVEDPLTETHRMASRGEVRLKDGLRSSSTERKRHGRTKHEDGVMVVSENLMPIEPEPPANEEKDETNQRAAERLAARAAIRERRKAERERMEKERAERAALYEEQQRILAERQRAERQRLAELYAQQERLEREEMERKKEELAKMDSNCDLDEKEFTSNSHDLSEVNCSEAPQSKEEDSNESDKSKGGSSNKAPFKIKSIRTEDGSSKLGSQTTDGETSVRRTAQMFEESASSNRGLTETLKSERNGEPTLTRRRTLIVSKDSHDLENTHEEDCVIIVTGQDDTRPKKPSEYKKDNEVAVQASQKGFRRITTLRSQSKEFEGVGTGRKNSGKLDSYTPSPPRVVACPGFDDSASSNELMKALRQKTLGTEKLYQATGANKNLAVDDRVVKTGSEINIEADTDTD